MNQKSFSSLFPRWQNPLSQLRLSFPPHLINPPVLAYRMWIFALKSNLKEKKNLRNFLIHHKALKNVQENPQCLETICFSPRMLAETLTSSLFQPWCNIVCQQLPGDFSGFQQRGAQNRGLLCSTHGWAQHHQSCDTGWEKLSQADGSALALWETGLAADDILRWGLPKMFLHSGYCNR